MKKTIISLTTMPGRIERIEPTLDALLKQGLPVYLWLPFKIARFGDKPAFSEVPKSLNKYIKRGLQVFITDDLGPATKLLPALETDADRIITADDDRIFGEGWAQGLLDGLDRNPGCAVSYWGDNVRSLKEFSGTDRVRHVKQDTPIDVVTGCSGVAYERWFFTKDIRKKKFINEDTWTQDDIMISCFLKYRGIPMFAIPECGGKRKINKMPIDLCLYPINKDGGGHLRTLKKLWLHLGNNKPHQLNRKAQTVIINIPSKGAMRGAEIGVGQGKTSMRILKHRPNIKMLYLVDPWKEYNEWCTKWGDDARLQTTEKLETWRKNALKNIEPYKDRVEVLRMTSLEGAKRVRDNELDFVFIDGSHTYESVSADLAAWWPKVKSGGVVMGDDYDAKQMPWLIKAFDEFAEQHGVRAVGAPHRTVVLRKP